MQTNGSKRIARGLKQKHAPKNKKVAEIYQEQAWELKEAKGTALDKPVQAWTAYVVYTCDDQYELTKLRKMGTCVVNGLA